MEGKVEYTDSSTVHTANYLRNSKAVGVLWGVFTICFAIINIVVFMQPQWIGDSAGSQGSGYFGLWKHCQITIEGVEICKGSLLDLNAIPTAAFRAATVFVGLSAVIILLCIFCMLLFCFFHASTVFHICGWMQLFSAVCLLVGVVAYPAGWDSIEVREVCGPLARDYHLSDCGLRWSYILAMVGVLDAFVLSALAFTLATRHIKLAPEPLYAGSIYKGLAPSGEINGAFVGEAGSMTGSRRSMNLQPVMLMPPAMPDNDRFSEFSQRSAHSKASAYRAEYASSHNFQL